jgi:hypothetical protein
MTKKTNHDDCDKLTLIATFELRLLNEGGRVNLIGAEENVVGVCYTSANIAGGIGAPAIVPLKLSIVAIAATEEVAKLNSQQRHDLEFLVKLV